MKTTLFAIFSLTLLNLAFVLLSSGTPQGIVAGVFVVVGSVFLAWIGSLNERVERVSENTSADRPVRNRNSGDLDS